MSRVTRRGLIQTGIAAAAGAALGGFGARAWKESRKIRPVGNVVFILIDTLRADHLGCCGYTRATSPNIDALAAQSAVYLRNKSQSSLTTPSMASLFTSRLLLEHFVPPDMPTLPAILKRAGYRTIGIQSNPWLDQKRGFTRGFDDYRMLAPEGSETELLEWEKKTVDRNVFYADAEAVFQAARRAIESLDAARPFFLYLHYMDVHGPYVPKDEFDVFSAARTTFSEKLRVSSDFMTRSEDFLAKVDRLKDTVIALYDGEIRGADHSIGNILTLLKDKGLYDRTTVIIASDHGEHFGEHGRVQHANGLYEEVLHTPLIAKSAGQSQRSDRKFLTSNADIARAILFEVGFKPYHVAPYALEGRSLQGVPSDAPELCKAALIAHDFKDGYFSVEKEGFKLIVETGMEPAAARPDRFMLFNTWKDPSEDVDLSKSTPSKVEELIACLERYRKKPLKRTDIEKTMTREEREKLEALGYAN